MILRFTFSKLFGNRLEDPDELKMYLHFVLDATQFFMEAKTDNIGTHSCKICVLFLAGTVLEYAFRTHARELCRCDYELRLSAADDVLRSILQKYSTLAAWVLCGDFSSVRTGGSARAKRSCLRKSYICLCVCVL